MENYIVINGKKAELTEEQLEKLGIEVKNDPFKKEEGHKYFCIENDGTISCFTDCNDPSDIAFYDIANYCKDEKLMRQRTLHETLNRLLWRFSMRNEGDKLAWKDTKQLKWYIYFDYLMDKFYVASVTCTKNICPYFVSKEVAQRAIDEIIKPFMEEHPEFVW